jgi:hypothetical protein
VWWVIAVIVVVLVFWGRHMVNNAAREQVRRNIQQELDDYENSHPDDSH